MKRSYIFLLSLLACLMLQAQAPTEWPVDTVNGQAVYRYQVQKSEGLYRISKNFGVTQEQLIRWNPELETEGLKLGQKILIPIIQKLDSSTWETHVLEPKETLYGLSRRYGVSVAELQQLNPEVSARMAIGDKLLIRKKEIPQAVQEALAAPVTPEEPATPAAPEKPEEPEEPEIPENPVTPEAQEAPAPAPALVVDSLPIRLAFLLPLQADVAKRDAQMSRFTEFYEGALLAIYEEQKRGQLFQVYCYDVEKSDVGTQHVLQRSEMKTVDAIIGPAYPAQVSYASLFAKQNRIPTIVPFTSKVNDIELNPYLVRFNPNEAAEAQAIIDNLMPQRDHIHLVLIDTQEGDRSPLTRAFCKLAADSAFSSSVTTTHAILNDSLGVALADGRENILVFNNDKYSAVQVVLNKVVAQKNGHELTLLGRYAWAEEKCVLPMLYTSVFRSTLENEEAYRQLYKHYYRHDPTSHAPRYDLLGYDITRMTIQHLQAARHTTTQEQHDAAWSTPYAGLQSNIQLHRTSAQSGMVNQAIEVIRK